MEVQPRDRVREIIAELRTAFPDAKVSLEFGTPHQLLVATILSAQCTDIKVNQVTPALFAKYRSPQDFADADPSELERDVHATGFFRQKTKSIIESAQDIVHLHGGEVPDSMEELTQLRGVGRKTANVVLSAAFGKPGIIVDTHVLRISGLLGLADPKLVAKKDADKVERELMAVVPEEDWSNFSNLIVALGRSICPARKPRHDECPILHLCPTGQKGVTVG
ncbi:MAG: endonuclease III [Armatimonadetes bacterium]|nr:endonuclease III [Armatimonadota bacterium]